MKKFLTIGRDDQCDIRINDDSDVTSRKHAMLEVGRNGKYFITDQSRNGTYVNGIRMTSGERIPITRKDSVSFAHVAELNWEQVPVDRARLKIILVSLAVLLVAGGVGFSVWYFTGDKAEETVETISTEVASQPSGGNYRYSRGRSREGRGAEGRGAA